MRVCTRTRDMTIYPGITEKVEYLEIWLLYLFVVPMGTTNWHTNQIHGYTMWQTGGMGMGPCARARARA